MHLELLLEELSAEATMLNLLPILAPSCTFRTHVFEGKEDMLSSLPGILKGYKTWIGVESKIVVLVDRDNDDCKKLKAKLDEIAQKAGLMTKGNGSNFQVVNRIAIEEIEAWFFGDPDAIRKAYPKVSKAFEKKQKYRNPDAVTGGTWEALEALLQRAGYYPAGIPKIEVARNISTYMNPEKSNSPSFRIFVDGIRSCVGLIQCEL
jgi:hypothetical protein